VIDMSALQAWLVVAIGWWDRQDRERLAVIDREIAAGLDTPHRAEIRRTESLQ